ncbi:hypothetical protein ACFPRL_24485 [Pseudoclavibacter helvolus]
MCLSGSAARRGPSELTCPGVSWHHHRTSFDCIDSRPRPPRRAASQSTTSRAASGMPCSPGAALFLRSAQNWAVVRGG